MYTNTTSHIKQKPYRTNNYQIRISIQPQYWSIVLFIFLKGVTICIKSFHSIILCVETRWNLWFRVLFTVGRCFQYTPAFVNIQDTSVWITFQGWAIIGWEAGHMVGMSYQRRWQPQWVGLVFEENVMHSKEPGPLLWGAHYRQLMVQATGVFDLRVWRINPQDWPNAWISESASDLWNNVPHEYRILRRINTQRISKMLGLSHGYHHEASCSFTKHLRMEISCWRNVVPFWSGGGF